MANKIPLVATLAAVAAQLFAPLALAEVVSDSPSQVEHVQALPGDGEVSLSWDAATGGVEGYNVYIGLKSVEDYGGSYTLGSTDVGDSTNTVIDHLTNGVTYYFAVKAYDADDNESAEFSKEVEATPEVAETGDFTSPTVDHVSALSSTLVEVRFSEDVVLPEDAASGFSLEASDGEGLEVLDAYLSTEDSSTVYLVTDTQTAGAMYTLTASATIEDAAGNPISSGTSDTGVFAGSALEKAEVIPDSSADSVSSDFAVDEVEVSDMNTVVLHFNQKIVSAQPSSFVIQEADDATQTVEVLAVSMDAEDASLVSLVTGDLKPGYDYVITIDERVLNEDGQALSAAESTVEFSADTLQIKDVIAPEDVTDFLAKISNESTVVLSWTASVNSAGDLAKYLVYQSTDGGDSFGDAVTLSADATDYKVSGLTPGATYTFKVTAVDENGNESDGVLTTVTLPESGPELFVLVPLALAGAAVVRRKKRA